MALFLNDKEVEATAEKTLELLDLVPSSVYKSWFGQFIYWLLTKLDLDIWQRDSDGNVKMKNNGKPRYSVIKIIKAVAKMVGFLTAMEVHAQKTKAPSTYNSIAPQRPVLLGCTACGREWIDTVGSRVKGECPACGNRTMIKEV